MRHDMIDIDAARQFLHNSARRNIPAAHHQRRPRLLLAREIGLRLIDRHAVIRVQMHNVFIVAEMVFQILKEHSEHTIRVADVVPVRGDIDGAARQVHTGLLIGAPLHALPERQMRLNGGRRRLLACRIDMRIGKMHP